MKFHYPHYRWIKSILYEEHANIVTDLGQMASHWYTRLWLSSKSIMFVFQLCKCNQMFKETLVFRSLFYFCITTFSVVIVNIFTYLIKCWTKSWPCSLKRSGGSFRLQLVRPAIYPPEEKSDERAPKGSGRIDPPPPRRWSDRILFP